MENVFVPIRRYLFEREQVWIDCDSMTVALQCTNVDNRSVLVLTILHGGFVGTHPSFLDMKSPLTSGSSMPPARPPNEKFRKNMIELGRSEEICREMDKLANEDHTHHITPDEIRVHRNNWWIRSNIVSSDTMPVKHRADFKQALTNLATAQEPGGYSLLPKLAKLFLILVELARILVVFFI